MLCLKPFNYQLTNSEFNTTLLFETFSLKPKIITRSVGTMTKIFLVQTFFWRLHWQLRSQRGGKKKKKERERERERERDKLFRKPKNIICENWKNQRCTISLIVKPQNFYMADNIYIYIYIYIYYSISISKLLHKNRNH